MKKEKFNGKLALNKQTIVSLNEEEMTKVQGGVAATGFTKGIHIEIKIVIQL